MYIKLKSETINDKTGTFYLCLNGMYGLSLLVVLGRDSMNYSVSYYVDSVKYYKDNETIYVDDISRDGTYTLIILAPYFLSSFSM